MEKALFYPKAMKWMWNYCIYLGPYIDDDGHKYDLGVYIKSINDIDKTTKSISAAIVFGDKEGEYLSGDLKFLGQTDNRYIETLKRAKACKLLNYDYGT